MSREIDAGRALLYVHGGGYCFGSVAAYRPLLERLAFATGRRVLAFDYRLAPEQPFPAAVEDATSVYRWLLGEDVDPHRVAIAGDSAGGGLTLATLIALRDGGDPLPACAVAISAWTDLALTGESLRSKADADPVLYPEGAHEVASWYLNGASPRTPLASRAARVLGNAQVCGQRRVDSEMTISDWEKRPPSRHTPARRSTRRRPRTPRGPHP